ncbi:MAG: type VI secretion system protein TssA [Burkholderiaceae bacterium]|jgi:type VI secretion system protein ImpA|nr:type VI secretion system protein TssA [Burkholderiaceae bacterium]
MFDLEALLAPVPESPPCGEDMLFSPQFDAIQQARQQDDPSLEQGDWITDLKEADWPFVAKESSRLLRESTKDLRLAVWLTEARVQQSGLVGLRDGYRLLASLCERYWEQIHPLPEEGDMDTRLGSIAWLVPRSVELLRRIPIVDNASTRYGLLEWDTAVELDRQIKRNPADANDLRQNKITLEDFDRVRHATPGEFWQRLYAEVPACQEAVSRFEQVFDEKTKSEGASFSAVKETLINILHTVERFAKDAGVSLVAAVPQDPSQSAIRDDANASLSDPAMFGNASASSAMRGGAGIRNRADAIAQLKEVAQYFERTEPSSPAAYLAKKAARWADMPLHAWLRNVIKNEQELSLLEDLLGTSAKPEADGSG